MDTPVKRNGGRRPGAGRKPEAGTARLHRMTVKLADEELAEVLAAAPDPERASGFVREMALARIRDLPVDAD
jgi:hypothetical protein